LEGKKKQVDVFLVVFLASTHGESLSVLKNPCEAQYRQGFILLA